MTGEPLTEQAAQALVERGMSLFDRRIGRGKWEPSIDLGTIDTNSDTNCPIGQIKKSFQGAFPTLLNGLNPADYGFALRCENPEQAKRDHGVLTWAWGEAIDHRLYELTRQGEEEPVLVG